MCDEQFWNKYRKNAKKICQNEKKSFYMNKDVWDVAILNEKFEMRILIKLHIP